MLRIGTVFVELREDDVLGRNQILKPSVFVSRKHVRWERASPSRAIGEVLHPNGVAYRRHCSTQWKFLGQFEDFTLRNGDQLCLQLLRRRSRLVRRDLNLETLFTFVGDYDSDDTVDDSDP